MNQFYFTFVSLYYTSTLKCYLISLSTLYDPQIWTFWKATTLKSELEWFFFFSSHTTNSRILAYHWILVHIINISTLKEQIASYSEGIFAAESKDCATGQENHLWVNLKSRSKSERMLGQRSHPQSNMEQSQLHKMLSLEVSPSPNWILIS